MTSITTRPQSHIKFIEYCKLSSTTRICKNKVFSSLKESMLCKCAIGAVYSLKRSSAETYIHHNFKMLLNSILANTTTWYTSDWYCMYVRIYSSISSSIYQYIYIKINYKHKIPRTHLYVNVKPIVSRSRMFITLEIKNFVKKILFFSHCFRLCIKWWKV